PNGSPVPDRLDGRDSAGLYCLATAKQNLRRIVARPSPKPLQSAAPQLLPPPYLLPWAPKPDISSVKPRLLVIAAALALAVGGVLAAPAEAGPESPRAVRSKTVHPR